MKINGSEEAICTLFIIIKELHPLQMPKCSLKRLLQLRVITCIFYTLWIYAILELLFYKFGQFNYTHIPEEEFQNELYKETSPHLVKKSNIECKYDEILTSTKSISSWEVDKKYDDFLPIGIANGSYVPEHCNPAFSVAILVTYRNRQKHLDIFLPYIHNFLRKQNIHYKIFLIEQRDEKPWNKGMLYNIGAKQAIAEKFPCLILHDVDLLPLDQSNLYACTRQPRHMSASIDKFRYVLPYEYLVGGVLAIRSDQFVAINGFSNRFQAWGGEDDDFYYRMEAHKLNVVRFPRTMSRYTMLRHRQETKNEERQRLIADNRRRTAAAAPAASAPLDGYSSVPYRALEIKQHRLFLLLGVKL